MHTAQNLPAGVASLPHRPAPQMSSVIEQATPIATPTPSADMAPVTPTTSVTAPAAGPTAPQSLPPSANGQPQGRAQHPIHLPRAVEDLMTTGELINELSLNSLLDPKDVAALAAGARGQPCAGGAGAGNGAKAHGNGNVHSDGLPDIPGPSSSSLVVKLPPLDKGPAHRLPPLSRVPLPKLPVAGTEAAAGAVSTLHRHQAAGHSSSCMHRLDVHPPIW